MKNQAKKIKNHRNKIFNFYIKYRYSLNNCKAIVTQNYNTNNFLLFRALK